MALKNAFLTGGSSEKRAGSSKMTDANPHSSQKGIAAPDF
jgi:hypothetical protein